jgi:hypothetical protein
MEVCSRPWGGRLADDDPLAAGSRHILEQSRGTDLSAIRVHADTVADRLAYELETDASAAGPHLFFRRGAYQPRTRSDRARPLNTLGYRPFGA